MNKKLSFLLLILIAMSSGYKSVGQTDITTSSCAEIEEGTIYACSWGGIQWAKTYNMSDFGIDLNEEFIITSGNIGLSEVGSWDVNIRFHIYEIDFNFPSSFSESNLIGSSQVVPVYSFGSFNPQVISVDFDDHVTIPANVERILVEVEQLQSTSSGAIAFAANTDDDSTLSWFKGWGSGCPPANYTSTIDLGYPEANFYINVSGIINDNSQPFTLNFINDCTSTIREFHLYDDSNISSVTWNFGDPSSGSDNTSNLISPVHDFTSPGQYSIVATITPINGTNYTLSETISIAETPTAHPVEDLFSCEDSMGSGISSNFDTSDVETQVLNGQTGFVVSYYDQNGNLLPSPLPNPFTNTQPDSQEITARVSTIGDKCCFNETTFNLITRPLPETTQIDDKFACDNDENGFTTFDLSDIPNLLTSEQSDVNVVLYDSNDNLISNSDYQIFENLTPDVDFIRAVLTNTATNCTSETTVDLIVNDNPEANQPQIITGCDENNDGFSSYFDTSNVASQVLNGQSNVSLSYFDQNGNQLSSPLPNPFTNSSPFNQLITVRVTDNNTACYAETSLQLQTVTQPNINQPNNLYSCDQGNGYAEFDTSTIEEQIVGNQTGLTVQYYDADNNLLPSPLPTLMENTAPFFQTIYVVVEYTSDSACYSETSFDLIINDLPEVYLESQYFICDLEPTLGLSVNPNFDFYEWVDEDGTVISQTSSADLSAEGNYVLTVTQIENGTACENSFDFDLIRSQLPQIEQVNHGELGNNYIEIIASGDGEFEYSIDDIHYQASNYFADIPGGIYTAYVRDKDGCGKDSKEVNIIDYPDFFTPNGDGYNDLWQIKGMQNFSNAKIMIFDRFGKLITQLSSNNKSWDGFYNGKKMMSNDYWFKAYLGNGQMFSGHFTLKR